MPAVATSDPFVVTPDPVPARIAPAPRAPVFAAAWRSARAWSVSLVPLETRFQVAAGATLLLLLLHMDPIWYLDAVLIVCGALGLLFRPLLDRENFWFAITLVIALAILNNWYALDNHKYLILYWCIAIGCSRMIPARNETLALAARLLIGLCFGFATLWKLLSPDFTSGSFFQYTLLTDGRFAEVAMWLGGVTSAGLESTEAARALFFTYGDPQSAFYLADGPYLALVARSMAVWTLFIEGSIAVLFLLPRRFAVTRWRDAALLTFVLTTYGIAPVLGFGWVLCAMGIMQSDTERFVGWPALYLAAILALEVVTEIPVAMVVEQLF